MPTFTESTDAPTTLSPTYTINEDDRFIGTLSRTAGSEDVIDVIAFNAEDDRTYYLDDQILGYGRVTLFNTAGTVLGDGAPDVIDGLEVPTDGVYFLRLEADALAAGDLPYAFTLRSEERSGPTTLAAAGPTDPYLGSFETDTDNDWIAIEMNANQTYIVTYTAPLGTAPQIAVQDDDGVSFGSEQSAGTTSSVVEITPTVADTYFAVVSDGNGALIDYTVSVTTEPVGDGGTVGELMLDYNVDRVGEFTGQYEFQQDTDSIAVDLIAGYTYQFAIADALNNTQFQLRDATGTVLTETADDADGSAGPLSFRTTTSGTYTLVAQLDGGTGVSTPITGPQDYTITATVPLIEVLTTAGGAVSGAGGNDNILGNTGNDTLDGGTGADTIDGAGGMDSLIGGGAGDLIEGGGGDDTVRAGAGNDTVTGGAENDLIDGGIGFDSLSGNLGNDTLIGLDGFDTLIGGAGDDSMSGNNGFDLLQGGDGDDTMDGGLGLDTFEGGAGEDVISGQSGFDSLSGGADDDTLNGNAGQDTLDGGTGNDLLNGGIASDMLSGGAGNDTLFGQNGFDTLMGGAGDDLLEGNFGNDTMDGGSGNDVLRGGVGADHFVFQTGGGSDIASDFQTTQDVLVLDATLFDETTPIAADLRDYASVDTAGDVVLTFSGGDSITFVGVGEVDALIQQLEII